MIILVWSCRLCLLLSFCEVATLYKCLWVHIACLFVGDWVLVWVLRCVGLCTLRWYQSCHIVSFRFRFLVARKATLKEYASVGPRETLFPFGCFHGYAYTLCVGATARDSFYQSKPLYASIFFFCVCRRDVVFMDTHAFFHASWRHHFKNRPRKNQSKSND